jgi:hypothetical protein
MIEAIDASSFDNRSSNLLLKIGLVWWSRRESNPRRVSNAEPRRGSENDNRQIALRSAILRAIQEVTSDYVHIAGCSRHRIQL